MTKERKETIKNILQEASSKLHDLLGLLLDGEEFVDIVNNSEYPFNASFDEVIADLMAYIYDLTEELK